MKNPTTVIIVIVIMVVFWGGNYLYKRILANQITDAMTKGDYEAYRKLVFSKRALFFLNPNGVMLMRASHCVAAGELEEAEKHLNAIRTKKMQFDQKINYVQIKSMLALNKKDEEMFGTIKTFLDELLADGKNTEIIESLIKENDINRKLYFTFDPSVIQDLRKQMEKAEGASKGLLCMSLAKAYHLNDQDKLATQTLKEGKKLLKGTMYEKVIEETIKDLSIMD